MQNDTTAINDIVKSKAEENQTNTGDQSSQQQQQQNSGGEGGAALTQDQIDAAAKLETENAAKLAEAEKFKSEAAEELLKRFNVGSIEELEEKLGKSGEKQLTKEEQEQADAIKEAELQKFAVEKGIMKLDDFSQLKTLKSKQDADLVFERYLDDWKEENPDVKVDDDTTEADILKLAKDDFEKEFKLNSEKESVKAKGIAKLAKAAAEIRNPLEESFNEAKGQFDEHTDIVTNFPKYVKGIEKIVTGVVPEKIEWFKTKDGEEDIPVEIDLPEEDRKEIIEKVTKRMQSPDTYKLFKEGKLEEIKERVEEYSEYLVNKKSKQIGNEKVAEIFLKRGVAKGSTTGAVNSFATQQKQGASSAQKQTPEEAKAAILNQPAFKPKR